MRRYVAVGLISIALAGCAGGPQWTGPMGQSVAGFYDNPTLVLARDHQYVWETVADVVDDYFVIEHEEPVRLLDNTLTEGRLDTFPKVGSTLLEPWHHDSANAYQRLESTLQSIRRRAVVRVIPAENGYWVDVVVFKELEDVVQPEQANAGAATFRYDDSLTGVVNPVYEQPINDGWIPLGRDTALEQRILAQLLARIGNTGCIGASPVSAQTPPLQDLQLISPLPATR